MKKPILFLLLVFTCLLCRSQDSCSIRISLLTCSPGEELYSTFGHTAIRVVDETMGTDYVFNYGTFEFGPDFYSKFVRGQLLYYLSVSTFPDFYQQYQYESRSIIEQVLNLDCRQKQSLLNALQLNAQPGNRNYLYDFLFDNCTTRAKEIIDNKSGGAVTFGDILGQKQPTFRELIYIYLDSGKQYWSKLGIDILLGAKMDRVASNEEAMFLPDNLMEGVDRGTINGRPLVQQKQTVLNMPRVSTEGKIFTPFVVFSVLLVLSVVLSFLVREWAQVLITVFDFLFFFLLGITGILLVFMWVGTDHKLTVNNYNLLWALPSHFVACFYVHKKQHWANKYFFFVFCLGILLLAAWWFLPQNMNEALLPIVMLIVFRSWMISRRRHHAGKIS